jgi:hypothetical protein
LLSELFVFKKCPVITPVKDIKIFVSGQNPAADLDGARQKATCSVIWDGFTDAISGTTMAVYMQGSETLYAWVEFTGGTLDAAVTIMPIMFMRTGFYE